MMDERWETIQKLLMLHLDWVLDVDYSTETWKARAAETKAAIAALDSLQAEHDKMREALERLTHNYCGTNRVSQAVRWARQVLGWDYAKGCADSVEAVESQHTALSEPTKTPGYTDWQGRRQHFPEMTDTPEMIQDELDD